jgi:hypothetical protein
VADTCSGRRGAPGAVADPEVEATVLPNAGCEGPRPLVRWHGAEVLGALSPQGLAPSLDTPVPPWCGRNPVKTDGAKSHDAVRGGFGPRATRAMALGVA